jgi:hypothetical protein
MWIAQHFDTTVKEKETGGILRSVASFVHENQQYIHYSSLLGAMYCSGQYLANSTS